MELIGKLAAIVGAGNVLSGEDAAPWGRDWTDSYHSRPLAVVRPGDTAEVSRVLALANETGTPVVPVGGNTGLSGGALAEGALMVSLARLDRIREVRAEARVAVAEAGVVLSSMHEAAEAAELSFPLIFGARGSAMIGGVLATNAGGSNVLRYGNARALCLGLEVVRADGRVLNLMSALHKDNSGYDLKDLFIGSEGTLGLITAAVLRLHPRPRAYATAMVGMRELGPALALLNRLQDETGGAVEAFEYMPAAYMRRLAAMKPDLAGPFAEPCPVNILLEIGVTASHEAEPDESGERPAVARLEEALAARMESGEILDAVVARSEAQRAELWARREVAAEVSLSHHPLITNDVALPVDGIVAFLDRVQARLAAVDADATSMTVGHLGDGNLHLVVWPSRDESALIEAIRETVEAEAVAAGGSFSAEHGIGVAKLGAMQRHKDEAALATMRAIKAALDPHGIMNPGKVIPGA